LLIGVRTKLSLKQEKNHKKATGKRKEYSWISSNRQTNNEHKLLNLTAEIHKQNFGKRKKLSVKFNLHESINSQNKIQVHDVAQQRMYYIELLHIA